MRAFNKNTGRPIVGYKDTCYFNIVPDSFNWAGGDPEDQLPDCTPEIVKSDEIIYWDDEGNECERWDLELVDFAKLAEQAKQSK